MSLHLIVNKGVAGCFTCIHVAVAYLVVWVQTGMQLSDRAAMEMCVCMCDQAGISFIITPKLSTQASSPTCRMLDRHVITLCIHAKTVFDIQFHVHLARQCDPGVEGAVVVGKLLEHNAEADYGYNAATNTYQDLVKAGIIDPLKVHPSSCVVLSKQCDWTSQSVHD